MEQLLRIMNRTNSFSEGALRVLDNFSEDFQRSHDDENLIEELQKFLKIMNNNDVDK
jgi:hypothetical protein